DPLVGIGRHFARIIDAFTLPGIVINYGLGRLDSREPRSSFTKEENQMWDAFKALQKLAPTLMDDILDSNEEDSTSMLNTLAKHLKDGQSKARSDDTSGLKAAIVDWVHEIDDKAPRVARNSKHGRGFNHPVYGHLLCPAVLDWDDTEVQASLLVGTAKVDGAFVNGTYWANFIYEGKYDKELPWIGLLRGPLLVKGYKHVFTSPSSVDKDDGDSSATRSGNAQINGMTSVTPASIAYVAVQIYFALCSRQTFDTRSQALDLIGLYNSILDYFEDPEEAEEVEGLLAWWNR
ncbi:hypothetical protein NEOLEDRAFT_1025785, partial [Neolentinus lepideus HHB14362 ss-1]